MPYEAGGRADKNGNRYEIKCVIYQILKVLEERIYSVTLEALGEDEQGVDIWIDYINGEREGQQCKGRNGSRSDWTIGTMKAHNIFVNWKMQLDRENKCKVSLISPLACPSLVDLIDRANNNDGNYEHFYEKQINESAEQFGKFYRDYTKAMELNISEEKDILKSMDYLKRTMYRQIPDLQFKELILDKIRYLFVGDENQVYDAFVSIIVDEDILGKKLTNTIITNILIKKNIKFRNLVLDNRIVPRIKELNNEYRKFFNKINNELIQRPEFDKCKNAIDLGESIIIHGKAGSGKSGCTEAILDYCEQSAIPVVAIKLDEKIPNGSAEKWGKDLGLSASISHCLHSISKDEKAVLILDQLDSLRWTQAHSKDSLLVCTDIINEVKNINSERNEKISVVFVCRTYDLENDTNIKSLFRSENDAEISWKRICVNEFEEHIVKKIVGEKYDKLTNKLKVILKTPSNLYIWSKLDPNKEYNECSTTSHLIEKWWEQLRVNCEESRVSENDVNRVKEKLVEKLDKMGRIRIPKSILNENETALRYLSSNGFLIVEDDIVSFTHQSILDYFLSKVMLDKFYEDEEIEDIIGNKDKQTPGRRYQVQMLLENLIEIETSDFIRAGEKMINSQKVRYYVKHVFYEVLGQISNIDDIIKSFVLEYCEKEKYKKYILNNVIIGHNSYIRLLMDNGILDNWMRDEENKNIVFNLLNSMNPPYSSKDIDFIKKYIFKSEEDDKKLYRCFFSNGIENDTDVMINLRIQLYEKYSELSDLYIDFKKLFKSCEIRAIEVFKFLLEYKVRKKENYIYQCEEEIFSETSDMILNNGKQIIKTLLSFIPCDSYENIMFSNWSNKYGYNRNLERTCVELIKKANIALSISEPHIFFEIYKKYMGKGYAIFNEIILSSLKILPVEYSDYIISYLCENFDENIFDKTSGNKNSLFLVKAVIEKHAANCSADVFSLLEDTIINYISPDAKELYLHRIRYNKETNHNKVYWSFWGELQLELLQSLPLNRISKKAKSLVLVLKRRFEGISSIYEKSISHGGWVSSPISGKKLSDKNWLKLLTNKKLQNIEHHNWKEVPGGFIESSIQQFASDFRSAVSLEPERMIKLTLGLKDKILDQYIYSLFSGVASSNKIKDISVQLLEEMIKTYPCDNNSLIAEEVCLIIENKKTSRWSKEVLDILKRIAIEHTNPKLEKPNVTSNDDKEMRSFNMLQSNAINCVRGAAAYAIGNLLWEDEGLYSYFKETINELTNDENPAVKLASLAALWPSYNIERDWASEKIIKLYEQDYRLVGFRGSKDMLFRLYPEYKERILNIILECYMSSDEELTRIGSYVLAEMYILKNEFYDEMNNIDKMTEKQAQAILEMVINYFDRDDYNDFCKYIICNFKSSRFDLDHPIGNLFYRNKINLSRDKDFLIDIMTSNVGRKMLRTFVDYIEDKSKSIVDYKDIILSMSRYLLCSDSEKLFNEWGIEESLAKLIIGLYDETVSSCRKDYKEIAKDCLDIWDLMFEKQIGSIRMLSKQIFER
ncbi:hypothetical protein [Clostridium butyricum]|uniref:hypothetical protein n=1 Tax=Clostridium butyricum TaxID=1492 RepID=UPI00374E6DC9